MTSGRAFSGARGSDLFDLGGGQALDEQREDRARHLLGVDAGIAMHTLGNAREERVAD
jgi:hypothetical protein